MNPVEQAWNFLKAEQVVDDRPCPDCGGSGWSTEGQEHVGEDGQKYTQLTPPEIPCNQCQTGRNLAETLRANENPPQTNMSARLANAAALELQNQRAPHPTTHQDLQNYWNPELAAAYRALEENRGEEE